MTMPIIWDSAIESSLSLESAFTTAPTVIDGDDVGIEDGYDVGIEDSVARVGVNVVTNYNAINYNRRHKFGTNLLYRINARRYKF
jgi:hypothetical protein